MGGHGTLERALGGFGDDVGVDVVSERFVAGHRGNVFTTRTCGYLLAAASDLLFLDEDSLRIFQDEGADFYRGLR